jgi:purine-binding chemotaxis protein CheW
MLQRSAGSQSQAGYSGQARSAEQIASEINNARSYGGTAVPEEKVILGDQYLIFTLLEREFAIRAEYIQGVERLAEVTPVPNVAPWIAGVINLRGSISSIVDLRAFLGMESLPYSPRTRLLSIKYNEMLICLEVDSVSEMVSVQPNALDTNTRGIPQWVASYSLGMAMVGKRQIILLDAARLLFADKMQHYSA